MNKKEQIKKIKELISMGNIVKVTKDNSFDDMAVWLSNDDKYKTLLESLRDLYRGI